jgi:hypothetical protein
MKLLGILMIDVVLLAEGIIRDDKKPMGFRSEEISEGKRGQLR